MSRNERRRQAREREILLSQLEASCQGVGGALGRALEKDFGDKRVGFMLMLFEFDKGDEKEPGGFSTYISNAQRDDMIKALQELIWRLKEQQT